MIKNLIPQQPDPYINSPGDQELAKFGHLRWLIRQINLIPPGSGIQSVIPGTDIAIDNTDPLNPVIDYTGTALPSQTGHSGQLLTTDGSSASWTSSVKADGTGLLVDNITELTVAGIIITAAGGLTLNGGQITLAPVLNEDLNFVTSGIGIITMNGAPTYTGTVAGAAGLSVVNGLIMA